MPKGKHKSQGRNSKQKERITRDALRRERKSGAYLNPGDPDFKSFANQLAVQGLALKDVPGDGNCLFRALSDQLNDGHTNHKVLRRAVVTYMRENKDDFAPFLEEEITFDEYMSELAKDGEYAGNDAIVAFSRCYSMHVVIHQLNAPRWEIHAPHTAATLNTLHIAYLNGEHYCSIRPLLPAESACATPLLPQLSMESGKGEEKTHTSSQRATHTSNKKKSKHTSSSIDTSITGSSHQHTCQAAGPTSFNITPPKSTSLSTAAERVAASTGCKDMALVEDCLRENDYAIELAVVEVLQLMTLAEETTATAHHNQPDQLPNSHLLLQTSAVVHSPSCSPHAAVDSSCPSGKKPPSHQPSPNQGPGSDSPHKHIASLEKPLSGQASSRISQKPGKGHSSVHHQQHHLSNRERKEQAKAARKQRRTQERKENRTKPSTGDAGTSDPVGATAI